VTFANGAPVLTGPEFEHGDSDVYVAMSVIGRIWRESIEYTEVQKDPRFTEQYADYLDAIDAGYGGHVADALRSENAHLNEELKFRL
jgi:hypothetical protein